MQYELGVVVMKKLIGFLILYLPVNLGSKMSSSQTKKKDKLDLSKLTARELLLIGESQTFSQPCSSKTLKDGGSHSTSGYISGEDSEDSDKQDTTDSGEDSGSGSEDDWEEVDDRHVEKELQKYDHQSGSGENSTAEYSQLSQIPENGLEIVIPKEGVFRKGNFHLCYIKYFCEAVLNLEDRATYVCIDNFQERKKFL